MTPGSSLPFICLFEEIWQIAIGFWFNRSCSYNTYILQTGRCRRDSSAHGNSFRECNKHLCPVDAQLFCDDLSVVRNVTIHKSALWKVHNANSTICEAQAAGILQVFKDDTKTHLADLYKSFASAETTWITWTYFAQHLRNRTNPRFSFATSISGTSWKVSTWISNTRAALWLVSDFQKSIRNHFLIRGDSSISDVINPGIQYMVNANVPMIKESNLAILMQRLPTCSLSFLHVLFNPFGKHDPSPAT